MQSLKILNVRVDNLSQKNIFKLIDTFLDQPSFHQIATINPEFILTAQKNPVFQKIINNCNLNIADGFGVTLAYFRFKKILKARIAGADLILNILKKANQRKMKIFLAIKKEGLSNYQEIYLILKKKYPNLIINGADIDTQNNKYLNYQLPKQSYQLLFCNFGAPEQEYFINNIKNDKINLAIGVGGSFDFLTGKIKRAPFFMRKIGLEWLWRLLQQPKRSKRIWQAVIVFLIAILLWKEK